MKPQATPPHPGQAECRRPRRNTSKTNPDRRR
jgi:hypothetical protein